MWAQQLVAPRTFAAIQVPPPTARALGDGDVLLRVLAGGICGSDLPAFAGRRTPHGVDRGAATAAPPGFPLHEVVGEMVVGWATRFDALAERIVTRGGDVASFDPGLRPEHAVMLQPLACVLHAAEQVGDIRGLRVAVLGPGPIGLLFCHVLKAGGATSVTGVDRVDRSDFASPESTRRSTRAPIDGPDTCMRSSQPGRRGHRTRCRDAPARCPGVCNRRTHLPLRCPGRRRLPVRHAYVLPEEPHPDVRDHDGSPTHVAAGRRIPPSSPGAGGCVRDPRVQRGSVTAGLRDGSRPHARAVDGPGTRRPRDAHKSGVSPAWSVLRAWSAYRNRTDDLLTTRASMPASPDLRLRRHGHSASHVDLDPTTAPAAAAGAPGRRSWRISRTHRRGRRQ